MSNQTYANSQKTYAQTLPIVQLTTAVSGMISTSAYTLRYVVDGNWVTLLFDDFIVPGTAGNNALTLTSPLPAAIRPIKSYSGPATIILNGNDSLGTITVSTVGTVVIFSNQGASTTAQCGFKSYTFSYPLY